MPQVDIRMPATGSVVPRLVGIDASGAPGWPNQRPEGDAFVMCLELTIEVHVPEKGRTVNVRYSVVVCSAVWVIAALKDQALAKRWSRHAVPGAVLGGDWLIVSEWDSVIVEAMLSAIVEDCRADTVAEVLWALGNCFCLFDADVADDFQHRLRTGRWASES